VETRAVLVCTECQVHWQAGHQPARCSRADHVHQRFELHRHRSAVVLPDGTPITAVSFDAADPYSRDGRPDHGLYLDPQWQPPWPHDHLEWPDFGVPESATSALAALRSVLARARAGALVEVGCIGGHGRTGTALACLAILTGHPPGDAVAWVRAAYCRDAVETGKQEAFIVGFRG
jgi:protein-tyrosine phosphatase family protein